jgi:hypothetical protein
VYVWERAGKVWIVENGVKEVAPLIDISEEVLSGPDLGMLGFALHPNFAENGYIYLFYMVDRHHLFFAGTPSYDPSANDWTSPTIGRITRYTARASDGFHSVDPASRKVLLGVEQKYRRPGHDGFAQTSVRLLLVVTEHCWPRVGDGASFELMDAGGDVGSEAVACTQASAACNGIISAKGDS